MGVGASRPYAEELMAELLVTNRIDLEAEVADPDFSLDYLWGEARGQMFGVLEAEDERGQTVWLKAFSCQYNGSWEVPGWVPPILDVAAYERIVPPVDREIKALGKLIAQTEDPAEKKQLKDQRKVLSQNLQIEIHDLYQVRNFYNEIYPLREIYNAPGGIPTGCGDCCAPKLLHEAARRRLRPKGISEFYLGKANKSGTRESGQFYGSCDNKCAPILGYMLCGVN